MSTIACHIGRITTLVALCGCGDVSLALAQSPAAEAVVQQQSAQAQADYVVGSQDVLLITMWDQPDLSGKFNVDSDGTFVFPLIGRVRSGGLTLRDVEAELKKRLAAGYFKNPQLSVAVEEYRSQRIFIVGEVRTPGPYSLSGDMTLIEALARAGSTTETAARHVVIVHAPAGAPGNRPQLPSGDESDADGSGADVERVDLKALQSGAMVANLKLRDGDTVFVPKAESVFVFGQVRNPGAYPLPSETTVLQALSLAGGVTDRGSTRRIKIVRMVGGKRQEVGARLSDLVQAGDTVVVSERFF